jgi:surface antigen
MGATEAHASQTDCLSYGYACTPGYDATNTEGTWAWSHYGGQYAVNANGYHNCTLYAAWRLEQNGMSDPGNWGDAVTWSNYTSHNHTPAIGSIAWWGSEVDQGHGHVAYVDQINGNQVHVIADNFAGSDKNGYTDAGWILASSVDAFLHPHDLSASPGTDGIGYYDPSDYSFHLRNSLSSGASDYAFVRGAPGDIPLVGNWDGQGGDGTGYYDPSDYSFHLRNSLSSGASDYAFVRGGPGDIPLVGNWDGKGGDGTGYYDPSDGSFHLRNSLSAGASDYAFVFGPPHMIPLVGNWDGKGGDGIGYYDPSDYSFHLRNSLSSGPSDYAFVRGAPGDIPLVGNWDGK